MNKYVRKLIALGCCGLALLQASLASAQISPPVSLCKVEGTVFLFYNGVDTTKLEGETALHLLQRYHGDKAPDGSEMRYELMYNKTAGLEDFVETFAQRLEEQNGLLQGKFELFFESLHGGGAWWRRIVTTVTSAAQILDALRDRDLANRVNALASLLATPTTSVNYQEHRSRLDNFILEGRKMLFYAHSQGNLFGNAAYRYVLAKVPPTAVAMVHVAPASPETHGTHVLADVDLVINALRLTGTVPPITHAVTGYLLRSAGDNNKTDWLGHGLIEIYENPRLPIAATLKTNVLQALTNLTAPPQRGAPGFFTATVTWDGSGDVDTHVTEPDATHVWYASKQGRAGYLDVDNTIANGPEHYFASCDPTVLQTGTYKIALANFDAATGRSATVQVASYGSGVVNTKTVVMGTETGDLPAHPIFDVIVSKDPSGKFLVKVP